MPEDEVQRFLKNNKDYVEMVYYAFESAAIDAAKRGHAVAVLSELLTGADDDKE
jgi:hypothetical protein